MKFYVKVLAEAKKIDPDVRVVGWAAYGNYDEAPKHTKLNKDIVVAFVGHLMYPWQQKKINTFTKCWKEWKNAGATMILRPNFMLDGHNMPINFSRKFYNLYHMCLANGMIGTEFDSNIGQFGGNGLNYYVMARMTRESRLTYEQIIDEYCNAFSAASSEIKKYWNYWEKISDSKLTTNIDNKDVYNPTGAKVGSWNYFYLSVPLIYTAEVLAKGKSYLDQAERLLQNDTVALQRVQFLQKGLKHAKLTAEVQKAFSGKNKHNTAIAIQKLDTFRAEIEPEFVSNMNFLFHWENVSWDRSSLQYLQSSR